MLWLLNHATQTNNANLIKRLFERIDEFERWSVNNTPSTTEQIQVWLEVQMRRPLVAELESQIPEANLQEFYMAIAFRNSSLNTFHPRGNAKRALVWLRDQGIRNGDMALLRRLVHRAGEADLWARQSTETDSVILWTEAQLRLPILAHLNAHLPTEQLLRFYEQIAFANDRLGTVYLTANNKAALVWLLEHAISVQNPSLLQKLFRRLGDFDRWMGGSPRAQSTLRWIDHHLRAKLLPALEKSMTEIQLRQFFFDLAFENSNLGTPLLDANRMAALLWLSDAAIRSGDMALKRTLTERANRIGQSSQPRDSVEWLDEVFRPALQRTSLTPVAAPLVAVVSPGEANLASQPGRLRSFFARWGFLNQDAVDGRPMSCSDFLGH